MNIKTFFKAMSIKAKKSRAFSMKFVKSYVSLFVVLVLGVTSTIAWFTKSDEAEIMANNLEFESASSLRINKDKSVSNHIEIQDFVLDEASSVDGRNIYFPIGETFNEETASMFFREGNKGDENQRYVYKDFELKGTSGNTPVYIKSYQIEIKDGATVHDKDVNGVYEDELKINYDKSSGKPKSQTLPPDCPIRLAFISDSGTRPVVIDPSAMVIDYVENSDAVSYADDNGAPMTKRTATDSFASYYYGKSQLFLIPGGQNLPVTLVVWLEGTLGNCDKYIGKKISIDIDIESNFAEMEEIKFVDGTKPDNDGGQEHWVSNDNPIIACSYEDPYSEEDPKRWKTVIMTKSFDEDYTWTAEIPKKAVTNIAFYRLSSPGDSGEKKGNIYNSWRTAEKVNDWLNPNIPNNWFDTNKKDLDKTRQREDSDGNKYNALVYTAVRGNLYGDTKDPEQRLSPCIGYWNRGSSGSTGGGDTEEPKPSGSYKIGVSLNVPESKMWLWNSVSGGDELYVITENGNSYLIKQNGYGRFEDTFTMEAGDSIVAFGLKNRGASKYYNTLYLTSNFKITQNYNVSFTVTNEDKIARS